MEGEGLGECPNPGYETLVHFVQLQTSATLTYYSVIHGQEGRPTIQLFAATKCPLDIMQCFCNLGTFVSLSATAADCNDSPHGADKNVKTFINQFLRK